MFKRLKRMIKKAETPKDVAKWARRLEFCKTQYASELKNMKTYEDYYEGTRSVQADANGDRPHKACNKCKEYRL